MIILPDRHAPTGKTMLPMARSFWMPPSQRPSFDHFEHGQQYRWSLTARLHDGHVKWRGWFDDRDDLDAFLTAMAEHTLEYQPELWRMPSPWWHPDIFEDVPTLYAVDTLVFLTSTGAQTYTSPADWDNTKNNVFCVGGGASGAISPGTWVSAPGGGGGAYASIGATTAMGSNYNFATPGTTTAAYNVGTGGTSVSGTNNTAGNSGADTWFGNSVYASATVGAKAGVGIGGATANPAPGGAGGASASCIGGSKIAGGQGGGSSSSGTGAEGGGGAGGSTAAGAHPADITAAGTVSNGGAADVGGTGAGTGGAGSTGGTGSAGGGGSEWDASPKGSGGGGGGGFSASTNATGGAGGNYGGGGGGADPVGTGTSGAGIQGIVHVRYTPAAGAKGFAFRDFDYQIFLGR